MAASLPQTLNPAFDIMLIPGECEISDRNRLILDPDSRLKGSDIALQTAAYNSLTRDFRS